VEIIASSRLEKPRRGGRRKRELDGSCLVPLSQHQPNWVLSSCGEMASSSSLSSVVSQLVRASMGQSVGSTVTDEDLDRHVAELILKEAKQKEEKYLGKQGIRAYLPDTGL
jgi:hypothetical protein